MLLMQQMPESCYIHLKIHPDGAHQAGAILQANEEMREGYYIYVEPEMNRLVFRSWLRMYEESGKTFPYDIELEVPLRRPGDGVIPHGSSHRGNGRAGICKQRGRHELSYVRLSK